MKNEFKWRGILPLALSACLLTALVSCGSDDDDSSSDSQAEEQTQEGVFTTTLVAENPSVSTAAGSAEVSILGDDLNAKVIVAGARLGPHAQHIHTGTRCPTPADDTNGDGVVDATEASAVYGDVLLALDSELETNGGNYPSGIAYNYDEDASVTQVLTNLGLGALALEGKVVNIHGVPESTELPATVQGGKENFPISCGVLTLSSTATTTAEAAAASAASDATAAASTAASTAEAAASDATAAASTAASSAETAASSVTSAAASSTGTTY